MEQLRAVNALEPFVILAKSAKSPRAAADLVTQATSAPNTYVFAELLQTDAIRALQGSKEYSKYATLLEIFAWGTWADYDATPNLPKLSSKQHEKLLLLSLLPLASQNTPLTYQTLMAALPSITTTETLETLLTTAFYADLIHGSLDPHNKVLHVTYVAPLRDLAPGSIPALTETFENWSAQCTSMLDELQRQIDHVHQKARAKTVRDERIAKMLDEKVTAADEKETGKRKQFVDDKDRDADDKDADPMDVDGESARLKGTKRTLLGLGKKVQGPGNQI